MLLSPPFLQVLGGDFNAYHDFQWPIDFLLHNDPVPTPLLSDTHPCGSVFRQRERTRESTRSDVGGNNVGSDMGGDAGGDTGGDGAGGRRRRVDGGRRFRDVYPSLYPPRDHIRLKNLYVITGKEERDRERDGKKTEKTGKAEKRQQRKTQQRREENNI